MSWCEENLIVAVIGAGCCSGGVRRAKAREVGWKIKSMDLGHAVD